MVLVVVLFWVTELYLKSCFYNTRCKWNVGKAVFVFSSFHVYNVKLNVVC